MCSLFTSLLTWRSFWQKQHMLQVVYSFVGRPKVNAKCHMSLVPSNLAHHMRGPFLIAGKLGCRGRNCHDCAGFSRHECIPARSKHVEILPNRSDLTKLRACMKHGSRGVQIQRLLSWVQTFYRFLLYVLHWKEPSHLVQQIASCILEAGAQSELRPYLGMSTFTYGRHLSLQRAAEGHWEFIQSEVRNFRPFETRQKAKLRQQKSPGELLVLVGLIPAHAQNHCICTRSIYVYIFQVSVVLFLHLLVNWRGLCQ